MGVYTSDDSDVDSESAASGSDDGSDDDDDDMASVDSESEVDSEYEGALDKLGSFVEQLESRKRKNLGDDESPFGDDSGKKKKRVVLKERTEAYPEGEFVAVGAHDGEDDGALTLLLSCLSDEPT